jgi:nucleoid DNA-binding protein
MSFKARFDANKMKMITQKFRDLKSPIRKKDAEEVGKGVIAAMKDAILSGSSPIDGKGKFPPYKDPKKYPGELKPKTPVNLTLTGKFLRSLGFKTYQSSSGGYGTEIGYSQREEVKERGHREGANKQPKRPTIPSKQGEKFSAKIQKVIADIYKARLKSFF